MSTYLLWLSVPAFVLGLIGVGALFLAGNHRAQSFGGRIVFGFLLVLAAKGIAA